MLIVILRDKRRMVQEKEHDEKVQLKKQRRDLDQLSQIQDLVDEEVQQQGLRNQRRRVCCIARILKLKF